MARRRRSSIVSLGALSALGALAATTSLGCATRGGAQTSAEPVVVEVVDGDTLVVRVAGASETVRLLGVDTPETKHPTKPVECFGPEAAAFTASVLPPGTPVRLERDVEERDRFGRLLAHVHRADGAFVNLELVARGYASTLVIPPNAAHRRELGAAERSARAAGLGLWGACGGPGRPIG